MAPRLRREHKQGLTQQLKTGVIIELNPDLQHDPACWDEVLIHEFVHVLEFLNPTNDAFSPKAVNGCTALAQTVGKGLAQMLRELQVAPRGRKQHTKP